MAIELTESKHDINTTSLSLFHKDLPQKCKIHLISTLTKCFIFSGDSYKTNERCAYKR